MLVSINESYGEPILPDEIVEEQILSDKNKTFSLIIVYAVIVFFQVYPKYITYRMA